VKDDLWRGLQSAVDPASLPDGQDFKSVMDTWVVQSGYPVVTVSRNYAGKKIKLNQVYISYYRKKNNKNIIINYL
jgi:aminopeptidase N